jgi:hypothetical protein
MVSTSSSEVEQQQLGPSLNFSLKNNNSVAGQSLEGGQPPAIRSLFTKMRYTTKKFRYWFGQKVMPNARLIPLPRFI